MGPRKGTSWEVWTPVLVRYLLSPPGMSGPIVAAYWTHSYSNSLYRGYNLHPAAHSPSPPTHLLVCATCDIIVAVKIVAQYPALGLR